MVSRQAAGSVAHRDTAGEGCGEVHYGVSERNLPRGDVLPPGEVVPDEVGRGDDGIRDGQRDLRNSQQKASLDDVVHRGDIEFRQGEAHSPKDGHGVDSLVN